MQPESQEESAGKRNQAPSPLDLANTPPPLEPIEPLNDLPAPQKLAATTFRLAPHSSYQNHHPLPHSPSVRVTRKNHILKTPTKQAQAPQARSSQGVLHCLLFTSRISVSVWNKTFTQSPLSTPHPNGRGSGSCSTSTGSSPNE